MAQGRFSVEAVFKAVDKVTAPVTRMQNRVGKFTRKARQNFKSLNRQVSKFNQNLMATGRQAAASLAIVGFALTAALGPGVAFEQAITNVGAVSLKTRDQVALLEKQALELGATTKFTATEAANAMEIMARAGFDVNEILSATPAVLSAAAASGLEIAEVADHVSNALKGMGLGTNEAARVADVLALASSRTNSSIGSLGESLSNVASTARQLKIPFEEVVAGVALLQDVGLDASVAGSAFNTMLTKMAAPTTAMQKKMRRFGISFKDAKGDMLPLGKVLEQLAIASKKAGGNFDQVAFLAELVGLRGQKAASNLADLFTKGKFSSLAEELNNAAGAAEKMAALRMNTVQGSLLLLKSAVDAVGVAFFDLNNEGLKGTIDKTTKWVSANKELIATNLAGYLEWIIENFDTIIVTATRVLKVFAGFMLFNFILKTIIATMTVLNLVMAANPLVLAGIVIAGIATAIFLAWEPLMAFFKEWGDVLTRFYNDALKPIIDGIANSAFGKLVGGLVDDFQAGISLIGGDDTQGASPQVVNPQERVARSIEESRSTSEVTIRDETGRAEMTRQSGGANGLKIVPTGGF